MATILLRLSGAMQAWGTQSRFSVRDTELEPTKSGVVGLVAAAMGIGRKDEKSLALLAEMRFGVRIDREGVLKRDFQTASRVLKASGGIKETEISSRYYLANAVFLAGLEGALEMAEQIQAALANPRWGLYLGRRAFVPGEPVYLKHGLKEDEDLLTALKYYEPLCTSPLKNYRILIESDSGEYTRNDQPVSFATRTYSPRHVRVLSSDLKLKSEGTG